MTVPLAGQIGDPSAQAVVRPVFGLLDRSPNHEAG